MQLEKRRHDYDLFSKKICIIELHFLFQLAVQVLANIDYNWTIDDHIRHIWNKTLFTYITTKHQEEHSIHIIQLSVPEM